MAPLISVTFLGSFAYAASNEKVSVTLNERVDWDAARNAFDLVNQERISKGKAALVLDSDLMKAARTRAEEIAIKFGHTRPDGTNWNTAPNVHTETKIAENIAAGQISPAEVVNGSNGWINSATHYAALISSDYKSTGLACVNIGGTNFWVQLFSSKEAKPLGSGESTGTDTGSVNVNTLVDNLDVAIVFQPKVANTETTAKYSIVHRNHEFDIPLKYAQFTGSISPAGPSVNDANGEIATGTVVGTYELSLALNGSSYTKSADLKIKLPADFTPPPVHTVTYEFVDSDGNTLFDSDGNRGNLTTDDFDKLPPPATFDTGSKIYAMPDAKKKQYTFSGWSTGGAFPEIDEAIFNGEPFKLPDADIVLKGSFETSVYHVNYNDYDFANGKTVLLKSIEVNYDSVVGSPILEPTGFVRTDMSAPEVQIDGTFITPVPDDRGYYVYEDRPYQEIGGTTYILGGVSDALSSWQATAETINNAEFLGIDKFPGTDIQTADADRYTHFTGDVNLYLKRVNLDIDREEVSSLEDDMIKVYYYASLSDLIVDGSGGFSVNNPIAVRLVPRDKLVDTPILPESGNVSIEDYFKNDAKYDLDSEKNSTYKANVNWSFFDFSTVKPYTSDMYQAPMTWNLDTYNDNYGYKKHLFDKGAFVEEDLHVDEVTTFPKFFNLVEQFSRKYIEANYSKYYDGDDNRIEDPGMPGNYLVDNDQMYLDADRFIKDIGLANGSPYAGYTSINIFISGFSAKLAFDANLPADVANDFAGDNDALQTAIGKMGLPDLVPLNIDEENFYAGGNEKVNVTIPKDVPSLGSAYSQIYAFKGWTLDEEGNGTLYQPGENILVDANYQTLKYGANYAYGLPLYAKWEKRTYTASYYFQASDSTPFATKDLEWEDEAFPDVPANELVAALFTLLGVDISEYDVTASAAGLLQVALGTDDEGDDITLYLSDYSTNPNLSANPSTVSEFLATKTYDYINFILDWEAVKPAGMDLTVESDYVDNTPADPVVPPPPGDDPPKDDPPKDDPHKDDPPKDPSDDPAEDPYEDPSGPPSDNSGQTPAPAATVGRNTSTPLAAPSPANALPAAPVDTIAPPPVATDSAPAYNPEGKEIDPVQPPGEDHGLTPAQTAIIIGVLAAAILLAVKFGVFSALKTLLIHNK
ncbi:MAG: CAP domain-containing protein [Clostridiales Family XIII bacterium]|nr:CAP domain-containing protein [Clostridiales Family XIII bacterium]